MNDKCRVENECGQEALDRCTYCDTPACESHYHDRLCVCLTDGCLQSAAEEWVDRAERRGMQMASARRILGHEEVSPEQAKELLEKARLAMRAWNEPGKPAALEAALETLRTAVGQIKPRLIKELRFGYGPDTPFREAQALAAELKKLAEDGQKECHHYWLWAKVFTPAAERSFVDAELKAERPPSAPSAGLIAAYGWQNELWQFPYMTIEGRRPGWAYKPFGYAQPEHLAPNYPALCWREDEKRWAWERGVSIAERNAELQAVAA
jgi:hypothetical protein